MDRRTLLFIIAVSLTMFFVNLFFQNQTTQKKQEWLAQQKDKQVLKEQKISEEIQYRTAPLSSLPLVEVYADENNTQLLGTAIRDKDSIIALSWSEEMPQKVFVQNTDSDQAQEYELTARQPGIGSAVIYQSNRAPLKVETLPELGLYDLQLVYFNKNNETNSPVEVALAEYDEGQISFLRSNPIPLIENERYNAIALLKTPQGYAPVGFYDRKQNTIVRLQNVPELASTIKTSRPTRSPNSNQQIEERYYVLENAYQQLVFSNYGGALAEINLPFRSETNQSSVVREIEFDREMVNQHPYNALFPIHGYYTPSKTGDAQAFEWHEKGQLGGYYPLIRRDLIRANASQNVNIPPNYYALNLVSEYPELSRLVYEVKDFTKDSITFEAVQQHRRITKTFKLGPEEKEGPYSINMDIKVEGDSRGLWLTSGVPEVEWISGAPAPSLKDRITRNQKSEVQNIDLPKDTTTVSSVTPDWICNSNGFLGTILDPLTDIDSGYRVQRVSGTDVPSRLVEIDRENDHYQAANMPGYMTLLPLKSKGGSMQFRLFAGPFDTDILKTVDTIYSDPATGYNPDYIACQTMHGWFTFISEPFAKFLLILLNFFHYLTNSWALSIVLLTACLRLILYPLNNWSTRSMVQMQQIAPEVTAIQEKYKKDPKKAQMEVINLYREKGINPASGCLPLLIQMPFLVGMFDLLKSSFALRGASFIPGWIDDLTAPDVLFRWNYPIFFIGNEFHLLPILLGVVMFVQQRFFSTAPKDPKMMTDQQRQQRMMGTMMSFVFAIMFYNFPSGLNIYWLSSMILGMIQQWYITRKMQKQHDLIIPVQLSAKKTK